MAFLDSFPGSWLVLTILAGLAGAGLVFSLLSYRRLAHIPGPWLSSVSYLPMFLTSLSGRMHEVYTAHSAQYGPLVRIGPHDLLTSDPDLIRCMSKARSPCARAGWYRIMTLDPTRPAPLIGTLDTARHNQLKRKMAPGYGGRKNATESDVDSQLTAVVQALRARCGAGRRVDLARLAQHFTLDSIAKLAYGKEFGCVREDRDTIGYAQAVARDLPFLAACGDVPWLRALFLSGWAMKLLGPKEGDARGMGRLLRVANEVVEHRFGEPGEGHRDMLASFMQNGLTKEECTAEMPLQIIAGADTTATAIRTTMLYILATPRVYQRLRAEIDAAIHSKQASAPITLPEARGLHYLQAVIHEGLRIHPPFVGLALKTAPTGGLRAGGFFIPGGTRVGHSIRAITRDAVLFGDDADLYRPERWLDASPEVRKRMADAVDLVFGYGTWACAGKPIAMLEMNKFIFEVLRHFDLQLTQPETPWRSRCHNLFMQEGMWVAVSEH